MPKISAILPLYNGINYITEAIESIQNQTFSDWELIIVNEYGSDDGCEKVVLEYAKSDSRIQFQQNKKYLGLAESLNSGIAIARGKYIARVDVDDPSYPERFEKQVIFLEEHPGIALCGTLQRSVSLEHSCVEEVPCEGEELKAALLFGCEISHCSVMFRRHLFLQNNWKYDKNRLGEDYDLWTRIMFNVELCNLPEVLVDHRWGVNNISLKKGEALHQETREISARNLERFGIKIPKEDFIILSSWRNRPEKYARKNIATFLKKSYKLLDELDTQNCYLRLIKEEALQKILWKRWNWTCKTCGIFFQEFPYEKVVHVDINPVVSVILPVYEAVHTLRETIDSIIVQDYEKWELIIICEYDNLDGSTEIAKYYAKLDKRIKIVENKKYLGLAESLNEGIRNARGKYIARIDADDLANRKRLSTQVIYMDQKQNVGVTQFYQHYFGLEANDFIHRPPIAAEAMKAKLLFFCDACHSTVMIRKSILEQYHLLYSAKAQLEDYDLWIRLIRLTAFETIPEVYGEYRTGMNNISLSKSERIQKEMCHATAIQLKDNLGMIVPENQEYLLGGWINIFSDLKEDQKESALKTLQSILLEIWNANTKIAYYEKKALLNAIAAKWRWSKYNEPWQGEKKVTSIRQAIELECNNNWKMKMFHIFVKKPLSFFQSISLHVDAKNIEHLSNVTKNVSKEQTLQIDSRIEFWTWERYQRIETTLEALLHQTSYLQSAVTELQYQNNLIPYVKGEKVRIVFLFQIASFWSSWETLYKSCKEDSRVDTRLVFLDETNTEQSQMKNAQDFLDRNRMDYIRFEEFSLEKFKPHILVVQTPYDEGHRKAEHWSNQFRSRGYRLVYIPYGVEISDTEDSHKLHFTTNVINNCWRIYTFSEVMRRDYVKYCANRNAVRALGLPRFDYYFDYSKKCLPLEVEKRRKSRPIVLWKVHFPKMIQEQGRNIIVTPDLEEYVEFARRIKEFKDLFFVFMPHPKFWEKRHDVYMQKQIDQIIDSISSCSNAWIDDQEDYRNTLTCADCVIVDRSAIMVEVGALNVPVLYMKNRIYEEPLTEGIKLLIDSYYQGTTSKDMIEFLQKFREGKDTKALVRKRAFQRCIPYFNGKVGETIKEDMLHGVYYNEN